MKILILILALCFATPALSQVRQYKGNGPRTGQQHHHRHHNYYPRPDYYRPRPRPQRRPYYAPRYVPSGYYYPPVRVSDGVYFDPYQNRIQFHIRF